MKRILALFLSIVMLFTGCSQAQQTSQPESQSVPETEEAATVEFKEVVPEYASLDDENLLSYVENLVYRDTVTSLNSEEYFVENVSAVYISKEYLEEVAFNSQTNIYFGYNLADLNELFQGTRYVFTLGENGETTVQELVEIEDVTAETIIKNVAIGTGVILICVTVSVVSAGVGAPAVSMIFAASATTAQSFAVSSAFFGGASSGIIRYIQTGDINEAFKSAALDGSESFKWGAISGAVLGGAGEAFLLKSATKSGLTMNEAAIIQKESKLPLDVIKQLHSLEEYQVYKNAGLETMLVNGKTALVPKIDLDYVSTLSDGTKLTNLERMRKGLAPLDPLTGKAYELHHINQNPNGTLAVLKQDIHRENASILNTIWENSTVDHGSTWNKTRKEFWQNLAKQCVGG